MTVIISTLIILAAVFGGFVLWIHLSLWIMGLGVTEDDKIDWPWRKD